MDLAGVSTHFLLCNGKSCTRKGAEEVTLTIRKTIGNCGLTNYVHTTKTLCNGQCQYGPIVVVYPRGDWYGSMTPALANELVLEVVQQRHFVKNRLYRYGQNGFIKEDD